MDIKPIEEIVEFLRTQAELRSLENDERSILFELAERLVNEYEELDAVLNEIRKK